MLYKVRSNVKKPNAHKTLEIKHRSKDPSIVFKTNE